MIEHKFYNLYEVFSRLSLYWQKHQTSIVLKLEAHKSLHYSACIELFQKIYQFFSLGPLIEAPKQ